ncbi:hypothetical protein MKY96_33845 [Paenibacillus sp. FSL R7-0302]|uniref:hypothetical protein n=1 Tax=Paenibacillus sp. FSL R7-0302 TaxID=2921681 RepID=UPI0030FA6650
MRKYNADLLMTELVGSLQVSVPSGMKFVSIINPTPNTIEIYQDSRTATDSSVRSMLAQCQFYTQITLPIDASPNFTFIYKAGTAAGSLFKATVIFADENLNINGLIGNPGSSDSVVISADSVGLARSTQLPQALSANGALKVDVVNSAAHPVTVSGEMEVKNDVGNPLAVMFAAAQAVTVSGAVTVGNEVEVKNDTGNPLNVKFAAAQSVKTDAGSPLAVLMQPASFTVMQGVTGVNSYKQMPSQATTQVMVQAPATNTYPVKLGNSPTTCFLILDPGAVFVFDVSNVNQIYFASDANGQLVTFCCKGVS